jgi:hypothetical protein
MVAVVARHVEKSELFSVGERAHPTNKRNKLEDTVCGISSDIQPLVRLLQTGKCALDRKAAADGVRLSEIIRSNQYSN